MPFLSTPNLKKMKQKFRIKTPTFDHHQRPLHYLSSSAIRATRQDYSLSNFQRFYYWRSSIPTHVLQDLKSSQLRNASVRATDRNTLAFLEETQKYIAKICAQPEMKLPAKRTASIQASRIQPQSEALIRRRSVQVKSSQETTKDTRRTKQGGSDASERERSLQRSTTAASSQRSVLKTPGKGSLRKTFMRTYQSDRKR